MATVTTNFDVNTGLPLGGGSGASTTSSISGVNTITKLLLKDHLGSMTAEATIIGSVDAAGRVTVGSVSVIANGIVVHGFGPWGRAWRCAARKKRSACALRVPQASDRRMQSGGLARRVRAMV